MSELLALTPGLLAGSSVAEAVGRAAELGFAGVVALEPLPLPAEPALPVQRLPLAPVALAPGQIASDRAWDLAALRLRALPADIVAVTLDGLTVEVALELLATAGRDELGLALDAVRLDRTEPDLYQAALRAAPRTRLVLAGDYLALGPEPAPRLVGVPVGQGVARLEELACGLLDGGFEGPVALAVGPRPKVGVSLTDLATAYLAWRRGG